MEGVFDTVIPEIQHALRREHYEMPTPVQAQAIPPQVAGDDLFGSAQTGTGKTAAYCLAILPIAQSLLSPPMPRMMAPCFCVAGRGWGGGERA